MSLQNLLFTFDSDIYAQFNTRKLFPHSSTPPRIPAPPSQYILVPVQPSPQRLWTMSVILSRKNAVYGAIKIVNVCCC